MSETQDNQSDVGSGQRPELGPADRRWLLRLARNTVEQAVSGSGTPRVDTGALAPAVRMRADCFVKLYRYGELRGCIGSRGASDELWRAVIESAGASATQDPRFLPVTSDEVDALEIQISILTPARSLSWKDETDLRDRLKPHVHGVRIRNGMRRALYLPKVWEHFAGSPDIVAAFLGHLSQKAGDRTGQMWRDPATAYEVFEALDFGEADPDLAE